MPTGEAIRPTNIPGLLRLTDQAVHRFVLAQTVGIETENSFRNSACYVQSWIEVLKNDKRAIVMASAQAEKAVNYIMGKQSK